MKHFGKAILLSFRYKWTILLSIVNAVAIALLWSASISAVYPFVEIVFEGKTIHSWLDEGLDRAEADVRRLSREIESLRAQFERAADPAQRASLSGQIAVREGHRAFQEQTVRSRLRMKPLVDRWGPATPFGTLVLVIGLLIVATALKGICLVLSVVLVARVAGGTVTDLRRIFFREMLQMDQRTVDRIGATNLMTMLSHNVGLIQAGLHSLYGRSLIEPLKMISCLVVAAAISWQLLAASLLLAPLGF